ncbi:MAG: universal stress protein [Burkholderiales bacterium]|nr:universal stress protein [Burkholderiales bacterium]
MNAYRQLLVHVDGGARSTERLALARRIADAFGSSLAAAYAAQPHFVELPYGPEIAAGIAVELKELDDARRAAARALFDRAMREPGVQARWLRADEAPVTAAFAREALFADLLLLGQSDERDTSRDVPPDFVPSVLVDSGKPAIVVPHSGPVPTSFNNIAIAWKETAETARAVAAALPLLARAGRVVVLTWDEQSEAANSAGLGLDGYLRLHGIEPEWRRGGPAPSSQIGDVLLSAAFDVEADLLVMGAYGHSRAREWIMGGASRTVLASMTLPVLMAH